MGKKVLTQQGAGTVLTSQERPNLSDKRMGGGIVVRGGGSGGEERRELGLAC